MRTAFKLAAALAALIFSAGCWDRVELNDLAIVTAAAFDKGAGGIDRVTLQFFIPKTVNTDEAGGGGGQGEQTTVRFEEGRNIAEALSKLQMKIPRKIFWGQCKVFIFSSEAAKAGIRDSFDMLIRSPQPREHAYVFVSEGKASDALLVYPPIERSSAAVLRDLSRMNVVLSVTLEDLSKQLKSDSRAQSLPMVHILPAESNRTIPFSSGTAIFKEGRMTGMLSEELTRGVMWVQDRIMEYTVTFEDERKREKGSVSLRPVKAKVGMRPHITDAGEWRIDLYVRTKGDIIQNGTAANPLNPEMLGRLEQAFANTVSERIKLTLQEVQRVQQADILGFAEAFHRKYPKQWGKVKDKWDTVFPEVKVNVHVIARINRPGLINAPAGFPPDQVTLK